MGDKKLLPEKKKSVLYSGEASFEHGTGGGSERTRKSIVKPPEKEENRPVKRSLSKESRMEKECR